MKTRRPKDGHDERMTTCLADVHVNLLDCRSLRFFSPYRGFYPRSPCPSSLVNLLGTSSELRLQLINPSTSPNELNTMLAPHSIIHGDACFAYFNKIWGTPRIKAIR